MLLRKTRHGLGLVVLALACAARPALAVDVVTLASGEALRGEVIEQTAEHVILRHAILGELTISAESIKSVIIGMVEEGAEAATTPAAPAVEPSVEAEPAEEAAPAPPAPETPLPVDEKPAEERRWKSHLDLGVTSTSGTTDDMNLRAAVKTVWTRQINVITLDSSYSYSTSNGDTNENRFTAGVLSEWPRPNSRWSIFAQARYDFDEFNTWNSRVTAGAGVAYKLLDIDEPVEGTDYNRILQLKLRGGAGVAREFGSSNKDIQPEAIIGADLLWQLNSWQDLTASTTLFPALDDLGEFRIVSKIEWSMKMDAMDGVSLKLGLAHEHQSRVDAGNSHDQLSVYAALGIDF